MKPLKLVYEKKSKSMAYVDLSLVQFDPSYNRVLVDKRAESMAKEFDPDLIGVPVLSERVVDGKPVLFVVDAQHRIKAARQCGYQHLVACEVHSGLTVAEEARLFRKLNDSKNRKPVCAYDRFRAGLVEGDRATVEITEMISAAGLRVARAAGPRTVCAVEALERAYKNGNLASVLATISAWSDDASCYDGRVIVAVSVFLKRYQVAPQDLANKLTGLSGFEVCNRIRAQYDACRDRGEAARTVLKGIYNARRRSAILE